jgi:hypothetical protein
LPASARSCTASIAVRIGERELRYQLDRKDDHEAVHLTAPGRRRYALLSAS